jgi:pectinesterase
MPFLKSYLFRRLPLLLLVLPSICMADDIQYRIVVARDGSGDFKSIQQAVNSAKSFPDRRIVVYVRNGVYTEKVKIHEWNTLLSLVGESREGTVIAYGDHYKKINLGRNSTFYTATLQVDGDDFRAENLTVKNTAGQVGQGIVLGANADRVSFRNTSFIGNQDTLYLSGAGKRLYFSDCYIEGTTDFIFGRATALFENCRIHSKADSFITAASTPEGIEYGFVFRNCTLTAAPEISKVYLGRPWRPFARTVFIRSEMGAHILPAGWNTWNGMSGPEAENVFYAEYGNTGPGAATAHRAGWSRQLSKRQARNYSAENILGKHLGKYWFIQDESTP